MAPLYVAVTVMRPATRPGATSRRRARAPGRRAPRRRRCVSCERCGLRAAVDGGGAAARAAPRAPVPACPAAEGPAAAGGRRASGRVGRDGERVGAQRGDLVGDRPVRPGARRDQDDHGRDADEDARHRQHASAACSPPHRAAANTRALPDVHRRRARRRCHGAVRSVGDDPAVAHPQHAPGVRGDVLLVGDHHDVRPAALSASNRASTSSVLWLSSAPVGSSASSSTGFVAIARAMATRCCCPPDSCDGRWCSRSRQADPLERAQRPLAAAPPSGHPRRPAAARRCSARSCAG